MDCVDGRLVPKRVPAALAVSLPGISLRRGASHRAELYVDQVFFETRTELLDCTIWEYVYDKCGTAPWEATNTSPRRIWDVLDPAEIGSAPLAAVMLDVAAGLRNELGAHGG